MLITPDKRSPNATTKFKALQEAGVRYAGFWNRFAAVFIDVLILFIPQAMFGYLFGMAFVNRMSSANSFGQYLGFTLWLT